MRKAKTTFLPAAATGLATVFALSLLLTVSTIARAEEQKPVQLSKPRIADSPLMQILAKRSSSRAFSPEPLPMTLLSDLLWAANGINRPDTGRRTVPSARNRQEIDIYVATAEGLYLYEAKTHVLKPVLQGDIRAMTGTQDYVKNAAVQLLYVADESRMGTLAEKDKVVYAAADTGFISENVYLFCAAEGLATVVRAGMDRAALAKLMKLRPEQKIIFAQSIGYPKK
jgi:SagB-type dehydrogenase family enzyme